MEAGGDRTAVEARVAEAYAAALAARGLANGGSRDRDSA
jgi:hypothetical protein